MLGFGNGGARFGWDRRRVAPVYAEGGMVASAHPLTTATGLEMLQRGGNAVDAAVAAALTASVVMPEMCGLGGDLFAIVHDPASGETLSFLGSGKSPRSATIEQMRAAGEDGKMPFRGPLAVGVPGMVDGYFSMLNRHGSRKFPEVAHRAIQYAERGFPLTQDGAAAIREQVEMLSGYPASAAVFLAGGTAPAAGDRLKQGDLARTLEAIARHGPDIFYRGEIGQRIISAMREAGGAMELSDFADYSTEIAAPLTSTYRGNTIFQTGIPTQGLIMLEHLNIIEAAGAAPAEPDDNWLHLLVESKKLAYADRMGYAVDPAFGTTPMGRLLSKEWAAARFAAIDPRRAAVDVAPGDHADGDTTYLCVVDGNGMMVSLIQSVSAAFGCGMVAGDTGVVLNNRVGRGFSLDPGHVNIFAPGKKTLHTLNCFMIANGAGEMVVTGGTPGGDGQPQWNVQFITNMIDFDMDVQAAIDAPRWTSWPGTDPSSLPNPFELRIEERAGEAAIAGLAERGHVVKWQGAWGGSSWLQAIARDPATGVLAGATDPRVEGIVAGF
jgi:gamma-glutamyltranspeptidase / glutathione hydrolase